MSADANAITGPAGDDIDVVAQGPSLRRIVPPDTELLLALWKGVWSTFFTGLTLSGLLFACVPDDPTAKQPASNPGKAARHE